MLYTVLAKIYLRKISSFPVMYRSHPCTILLMSLSEGITLPETMVASFLPPAILTDTELQFCTNWKRSSKYLALYLDIF